MTVKIAKIVDPCSGQAVGEYCAEYFNGNFAAVTSTAGIQGTPVLVRKEAAPINYNFGTGSPAAAVNVDYFGARWKGRFLFEAASYTFTVTADDGIRLWVDGVILIDQWKAQAPTTYAATKALTAGEHEVRIEYFEATGGAVARASWAKVATTRVERIVDDTSTG